MKKLKFNSVLFLIFYLVWGCGFKVVNQNELTNFDVVDITSSGDVRINYEIKNKLLFNSEKKQNKKITINLETEKKKIIKEKNIKNEITKYQIEITSQISFYETGGKLNDQKFTVTELGEYIVTKQYSQTLNNEKKLIQLLTGKLIDKILDQLIIKIQ